MTEETKEKEENSTVEKLESVGQIIIGEMERLGGILTADPVSQTEGMLTEDAGEAHLETAKELDEDKVKNPKPTE